MMTIAGGVNDDDALALFELGDDVVTVNRRQQQHRDGEEEPEPRQPVTLRAETETNFVKTLFISRMFSKLHAWQRNQPRIPPSLSRTSIVRFRQSRTRPCMCGTSIG